MIGLFWMNFGYVIHVGREFFHKKFQGCSSKLTEISRKKCFYNVFIIFVANNSACENAPKFGETFFNYQIISKNAKDIRVFANHINFKTKGWIDFIKCTHYYYTCCQTSGIVISWSYGTWGVMSRLFKANYESKQIV